LHCIALHCIALHCIALHCIALHCIALHCIALHCIALHITMHITLHCIVLHYITSVEQVVLHGGSGDDDDRGAAAAAAPPAAALRRLVLSQCGIRALSPPAAWRATLRELILSDNALGRDGSRALADWLERAVRLRARARRGVAGRRAVTRRVGVAYSCVAGVAYSCVAAQQGGEALTASVACVFSCSTTRWQVALDTLVARGAQLAVGDVADALRRAACRLPAEACRAVLCCFFLSFAPDKSAPCQKK